MIAAPDSMFRTDSLAQWVLRVHDIAPEDATEENPDLRAVAAFSPGSLPRPSAATGAQPSSMMTDDGQRFPMIKPRFWDEGREVVAVIDFFEELKRLVPT